MEVSAIALRVVAERPDLTAVPVDRNLADVQARDVIGDHAVVELSQGKPRDSGEISCTVVRLERVAESWRVADIRSDRFTVPPDRADLTVIGTWTVLVRPGLWPWSGRYLHVCRVRASPRVRTVVVGGRTVPVPWHGIATVLWTSRSRVVGLSRGRPGVTAGPSSGRPALTGLDEAGTAVWRSG